MDITLWLLRGSPITLSLCSELLHTPPVSWRKGEALEVFPFSVFPGWLPCCCPYCWGHFSLFPVSHLLVVAGNTVLQIIAFFKNSPPLTPTTLHPLQFLPCFSALLAAESFQWAVFTLCCHLLSLTSPTRPLELLPSMSVMTTVLPNPAFLSSFHLILVAVDIVNLSILLKLSVLIFETLYYFLPFLWLVSFWASSTGLWCWQAHSWVPVPFSRCSWPLNNEGLGVPTPLPGSWISRFNFRLPQDLTTVVLLCPWGWFQAPRGSPLIPHIQHMRSPLLRTHPHTEHLLGGVQRRSRLAGRLVHSVACSPGAFIPDSLQQMHPVLLKYVLGRSVLLSSFPWSWRSLSTSLFLPHKAYCYCFYITLDI